MAAWPYGMARPKKTCCVAYHDYQCRVLGKAKMDQSARHLLYRLSVACFDFVE
jgi:hypothetical protein